MLRMLRSSKSCSPRMISYKTHPRLKTSELGVRSLGGEPLWCHVGGASDDRAGLGAGDARRRGGPGDAEVQQTRGAVGGDADVGGLQVTVDDAQRAVVAQDWGGPGGMERPGGLGEHVEACPKRHRGRHAHARIEVGPLHILRDQGEASVEREEVEDLGDGAMVEGPNSRASSSRRDTAWECGVRSARRSLMATWVSKNLAPFARDTPLRTRLGRGRHRCGSGVSRRRSRSLTVVVTGSIQGSDGR